jgi:hypothetical protein
MVYVPAAWTQDLLEKKIQPISRAFAFAPREGGVNKIAAAFWCSQIFMKCDNGALRRAVPSLPPFPFLAVPFPQYPCKGLCALYNNAASTFYSMNNQLRVQCDQHSRAPDVYFDCQGNLTTPGQDDFPLSRTIFANRSGAIITTECNDINYVAIPDDAGAFSDCPWPLVFPEDPARVSQYAKGSCAIPCPPFVSTKSDYTFDDYSLSVLPVFSYLAEIAVLLSLKPTKRTQTFLRHFIISMFIVTSSYMIGFFGRRKGSSDFLDLSIQSSTTSRCANNAKDMRLEDSPLCGIQAFFEYLWYGGLYLLVVIDLLGHVPADCYLPCGRATQEQ